MRTHLTSRHACFFESGQLSVSALPMPLLAYLLVGLGGSCVIWSAARRVCGRARRQGAAQLQKDELVQHYY